MRPVGRTLAVLLSAAGVSCSDGVAPGAFDGIPLSFSVEVPAAVSPAENSALADAFDQVDTYHVFVQDSATGASRGGDTVTVAPGQTLHAIDLALPTSTVDLPVRITVIGLYGTQELYRTTAYLRVPDSTDSTPVALAVRYTGPGVRGTLTNALGAGLAGVEVDLVQIVGGTQRDSVTTETDGSYLFVGKPTGTYEVHPAPPQAQFVCPAVRQVSIADASSSIVADFTTRATACPIDLLIVSGGDLEFANDTTTVKSMFAGRTGTINTSVFFFVNTLPGLSTLRQYDVVLLFSNGLFNQSAALGNQIGDYVQLGGNVITATFYWQNRTDSDLGSTGWGTLEAIDPFTSGPGQTYQTASLNANATVAHPLTTGLNALTSTGFRGAVAAKAATTVVARWSDNSPLVGYQVLPGGSRMVGVSLFPASGNAAAGDVQQLWVNAVTWAGTAGGPNP